MEELSRDKVRLCTGFNGLSCMDEARRIHVLVREASRVGHDTRERAECLILARSVKELQKAPMQDRSLKQKRGRRS